MILSKLSNPDLMLIKVTLPIDPSQRHLVHPCLWQIIDNLDQTPSKVWIPSDSWIIIQTKDRRDQIQLRGINRYQPDKILKINNSNQLLMNNYFDLPIFRSIDTFQQNDLLIAKKVNHVIKEIMFDQAKRWSPDVSQFYGIGGEFYLYFILYKRFFQQFYGYSNNKEIIRVADHNLQYHLTANQYTLTHINYDQDVINLQQEDPNIIQNPNSNIFLLINLSTIPIRLLQALNQIRISKLVIISCNQKQFNRRRSHLNPQIYRLTKFTHLQALNGNLVSIYQLERR